MDLAKFVPPDRTDFAEYRGWAILFARFAAPQQTDTGVGGATVDSCWFANLEGFKPAKGRPGLYFVRQPMWLTRGQMEKCRTDLDYESMIQYTLDMGLKRIKAAIDLYESGRMDPEVIENPKPDLDPRRDLNDPRIRIKVGPGGLKINKPV